MKILFAALLAATICAPAAATTIFSDTFNSYTGSASSAQSGTGLAVKAFGSLSSWTGSGVNAIHAVDRGASNWAIMFYGGNGPADTNAITMNTAVAANTLGQVYTVSFQGAAATYASSGQGNFAGDVLRFDVLNSINALVSTYTYDPADWTNAAVNPFTAGSFSYTGNGSGNVRLKVYAVSAAGHFGGAIDNLSIDTVPEPAMLGLFGLGAIGLGLSRRRHRAA